MVGLGLLCGLGTACAEYACSGACEGPDCVCATAVPPGGFSAAEMPQLILVTFDDSVNSNVYALVQQVLTNHVNPNGEGMQATFFVSLDGVVDYWTVQRLHGEGHEIAVHTMSHSTSTSSTPEEFRAEIVGCRKTLSDLAQIPMDEIQGFRAPYLKYNNASFGILAEQGMRYDASVMERPGMLSSNAASLIWPYTLDYGLGQVSAQTISDYPGLFEMPLWVLYDTNGVVLPEAMDPPDEYDACIGSLKYTFEQRYTGNRAPMGLFLHAVTTNQWLRRHDWAVQAVNEFLTWATTQHEDVWLVSMQALADFMQHPTNAAGCLNYTPFRTETNAVPPRTNATRCVYPRGIVTTCATCPLAYPATNTVYVELDSMTGGVLQVQYSTTPENRLRVDLAVSNDLAIDAPAWEAVFRTEQGRRVAGKYGGLYKITNQAGYQEVRIMPALWMRPLRVGETETNVYFVLDGTDTGDVATVSFDLQKLTSRRPRIETAQLNEGGELILHWDDSAYGYVLEGSIDLLDAGWTNRANGPIYGRRSWTNQSGSTPWDALRIRAVD